MPRHRRLSAPGMPFHITARTQGSEPLFKGHEARIVRCIEDVGLNSRVQLCAYAIMPNHLHLVVLQGDKPLGNYMHDLLQRIASLILRAHKREGHVFLRRYFSTVCADPEYFRNAIAYVHLNPIRARMCDGPEQYDWTSHRKYRELARTPGESRADLSMERALRTFGSRGIDDLNHCLKEYSDFLRWRLDKDALTPDAHAWSIEPPPSCLAGDAYWYSDIVPAHVREVVPRSTPIRRPDLSELAMRTISQAAPGLPLDLLRSGRRGRKIVEVRRAIIIRALTVDYRPYQIAKYLRISPATVSRIGAILRDPS